MSKKDKTLYTEQSIISETPREFTRRVPATYLGSARDNGNLIKEIFANAVDEAVLGHGDVINIKIDTNSNKYSIEDFGQGFLVNAGIDKEGKTILQRSFDTLNTSGKTSEDGVYSGTSLGLNGIGAKLTNWLSKKLYVITYRDGESEALWFKDGVFVKRKVDKTSHAPGTYVEWEPDEQFFKHNEPDMGTMMPYFEEISALCPFLTININYNDTITTLHTESGLNALIDKRVGNKELFNNRFNIERELGKDKLNISLTYTSDYSENISAYVNLGLTDSGAHISGFRSAFTKAVNKYANDNNLLKKSEKNLSNSEISEGLFVVFNMTTTTAKYDSQSKSRIDDIDVSIFNSVMSGDFATWLYNNPTEAKIIVERAINARRAREAAKKAKDKIREAGSVNKKSIFVDMPSKLSDAYPKHKHDRSKCELIIVEGDSAVSSLNAVKDSSFQATYPIRGKILNCQKATPDKVYANAEISNITKALGLDINKDTGKLKYDKTKLRYDKIIITCFTGDTKVKCLDGKSYSFAELIDNNIQELWIYSLDSNGNVVPAKATNIRKTGVTNKIVELTLDNGEKVRSTLDHFFIDSQGNFLRADELKIGDSLFPLYCRINRDGYEEYYDKNNNKYKLTHRMVAENLLPEEMEDAKNRLIEENNDIESIDKICVHHKNIFDKNNKLNNTPENLEWLTMLEHIKKHGDSGWTAYNVSDKHRNRVKEIHKQGVYEHTYFSNNGYNESGKHSELIKSYWEEGRYKDNKTFNTNGYNFSETHKQVVAAVNRSQVHIDSVNRSKILHSINFLLTRNLPVDEYHYDFYKMSGACSYDKILRYFNSIEEAIAEAAIRTYDFSDYKFARDYFVSDPAKQYKTKIGNVIKKIIDNNLPFTEETYTQCRGKSSKNPKYSSILNWFDSYDDAYEYGKLYNHKIIDINYIDTEEEPVYCMNVGNYHNFALDSGIFVKNCDADVDGSAISSLLITVFNWLCPELIYNGHLYRTYGALYKATFKDKSYKLFQNNAELSKWKEENPGVQYTLSRAKGLGELTRDETYEQLINVETRNLHRLTVDDVAEFDTYLEMFEGSDVEDRKQYLEDHYHDYDD